MKVYEITLTPDQLATITLALKAAAERWTEEGADRLDPDVDTYRERATRNRVLALQMDEVARDFTLVDR